VLFARARARAQIVWGRIHRAAATPSNTVSRSHNACGMRGAPLIEFKPQLATLSPSRPHRTALHRNQHSAGALPPLSIVMFAGRQQQQQHASTEGCGHDAPARGKATSRRVATGPLCVAQHRLLDNLGTISKMARLQARRNTRASSRRIWLRAPRTPWPTLCCFRHARGSWARRVPSPHWKL